MDSEEAEEAGRAHRAMASSVPTAAELSAGPHPAAGAGPAPPELCGCLCFFLFFGVFLYHLLQIPSQAAITSWPIFRSHVCIVVAGGQKSKDSSATESEAEQSVTTVHHVVTDLFVGNLIPCT